MMWPDGSGAPTSPLPSTTPVSIRFMATTCSKDQYAALLQGRPVPFAGRGLADGEVVRIYDPMHIMVGVGTFDVSHHILRPHKMFSGEREL